MGKFEVEEVAVRAEEFVGEILRSCQLQLQARSSVDGETVHIDLLGNDIDLVLADSARFLYALNHLVNQIFFRQVKKDCSFVLDCNKYRLDRAAELELMAIKAAERVRLSGTGVVLQPMPSSERRIIHLALAEEQGVRTSSEGRGRFRRVQIMPA